MNLKMIPLLLLWQTATAKVCPDGTNQQYPFTKADFSDLTLDVVQPENIISSFTLPMPTSAFPFASACDVKYYKLQSHKFITNPDQSKKLIFYNSSKTFLRAPAQPILDHCRMLTLHDSTIKTCEILDVHGDWMDKPDNLVAYLHLYHMVWRADETTWIAEDRVLSNELQNWRQDSPLDLSIFPVDYLNHREFIKNSKWWRGFKERIQGKWHNEHGKRDFQDFLLSAHAIEQFTDGIGEYDNNCITKGFDSWVATDPWTRTTAVPSYYFSREFAHGNDPRTITDKGKKPNVVSIHAYNWRVQGKAAYQIYGDYFSTTIPIIKTTVKIDDDTSTIEIGFFQTPEFGAFFEELNWQVVAFEYGGSGSAQNTRGYIFGPQGNYNTGVPPYMGSWQMKIDTGHEMKRLNLQEYFLKTTNQYQFKEYKDKIPLVEDCEEQDLAKCHPTGITFVATTQVTAEDYPHDALAQKAHQLEKGQELDTLYKVLDKWRLGACGNGAPCNMDRIKCLTRARDGLGNLFGCAPATLEELEELEETRSL